MRKKLMCIALAIGVAGLGYVFFYSNQYAVEPNEASIHAELTKWQNRGETEEFNFTIVEIIQLPDTTSHIVFFETPDENVGFAQLIKGWNGNFKIVRSGYGTNLVSFSDLQTNKGIFGLLTGKNRGMEIDHVTVESSNKDYSFTSTLPEEETFAIYKKLPNDLETTFLPFITLYNKNGEDLYPMRISDN